MRSVPETYAELTAAIDAGVYPSERTWIDFKRRLFPEDPADKDGRAKASLELSKDMASMAVHGGYLVYGVAEDKAKHVFSADPMNLPVGLHETVDAIARDRVTPALSVIPNLVADPADSTRGFLVIEIPASPDAPHMADGGYWGRSETGKVRLSDADVERLILIRSRQTELLLAAMRETARADPLPSSKYCHFYFTAVPATGWADMFAGYSRDRQSRTKLGQVCTSLLNEIRKGDVGQSRPPVAFEAMIQDWRSQHVAAGWWGTWSKAPEENRGRAVGLDDDGAIRYLNLGASGSLPHSQDILFVRELSLMFETWDVLRLVATLSDAVGYRGSWLFGVEFVQLGGHMSQTSDPYSGFMAGSGITWDTAGYSATTKAAATEVREKPVLVVGRLLRRLMRGLGTEGLLERPPFSSS